MLRVALSVLRRPHVSWRLGVTSRVQAQRTSATTEALVRKSLLSALTALVITGGSLATLAVTARRLLPDNFGQFVYLQWLVNLVFLVVSLGLTGAASRYLAEFAVDPTRRQQFLRIWRIWAAVIPIVGAAGALVLAVSTGVDLSLAGYTLLVAWALFAGWWAMQTAALVGDQRFGTLLIANVAAVAVVLPLVLAAPSPRASLEWFVGAMALSSLVALVVGLHGVRRPQPRPPGMEAVALPWPSIRRYAFNMWLTGLLWTLVWSRGELPLVRTYMGDAGVGQYAAALTIFFGGVQAIQLWIGGIAPHLTELLGSGRRLEAISIARMASDGQLLASGAIAVGFAAVAPELMRLTFGSDYEATASTLIVLLVGLAALTASAQSHLLQITTHAKFTRDVSVAGLAILYIAAIVAIPTLGTEGAALARVLAVWSTFGLTYRAARRQYGPHVISGRNVSVVLSVVLTQTLVTEALAYDLGVRVVFSAGCVATLAFCLRNSHGIVAVQIAQAARDWASRMSQRTVTR